MLFQKPTYDWLIAGLGNPGPEYEKTRHNTGFMSLDLLAARLQVKVSKERFKALTAQADFDGQRLLLMKPQTFMNASGIAIEAAAHFYKIPPERVLVLFDDISLPVGKLRIRKNGSAGGHNGLKSIISCLGSDQFPRVKIGVGAKPHPRLRSGRLGAVYRLQDRMARLSGGYVPRRRRGPLHRQKRLRKGRGGV